MPRILGGEQKAELTDDHENVAWRRGQHGLWLSSHGRRMVSVMETVTTRIATETALESVPCLAHGRNSWEQRAGPRTETETNTRLSSMQTAESRGGPHAADDDVDRKTCGDCGQRFLRCVRCAKSTIVAGWPITQKKPIRRPNCKRNGCVCSVAQMSRKSGDAGNKVAGRLYSSSDVSPRNPEPEVSERMGRELAAIGGGRPDGGKKKRDVEDGQIGDGGKM
jgi:hypothetical protein